MRVAIIGATSAIAQATAACFAEDRASLFLVARDAAKLAAVAADLRVRGAEQVDELVIDFDNYDEIVEAAGHVDAVLIAHGTLPDQRKIDDDIAAQLDSLRVNAISVIALTGAFANVIGDGTIAVIGSVAGDRGRRSNYVYGAAKAAIHAYCDGLRGRVHVLLIKPGFVDTPMTARIRKNPLFADPRTIGRGIHDAILARKATVYLPWYWRWISLIVRMLPSRLVKF